MAKKKLVILMDGTSNQISAKRTNILRLYGTLEKSPDQIVYYDPGVGTLGAKNRWGLSKPLDILGLAFGKGLLKNVLEAYRFIVENFEYEAKTDKTKGWQDEIYIFGFSRGAFSARILAGLLRAFGIIEKRNLNLLDYIFRAYIYIGSNAAARDGKTGKFAEINLYRRVLQPYQPAIKFLGVFDTVSSVIKPKNRWLDIRRILPKPLESYAYVNNNSSIETVRHAVALHEKRVMFRPCYWPESQSFSVAGVTKAQDQREVWFSGVHTDVGGGEIKSESGLAKIPLLWIINEAAKKKLKFNDNLVNILVRGLPRDDGKPPYCAPNLLGEKHKMAWPWKIVEFLPVYRPKASSRPTIFGFTISLFDLRVIPEGARIHTTALERAEILGEPIKNLPDTWIIEP